MSDGKKRNRQLTGEEITAALQKDSPAGLKLYLEHLIFKKNDSVSDVVENSNDRGPSFTSSSYSCMSRTSFPPSTMFQFVSQ